MEADNPTNQQAHPNLIPYEGYPYIVTRIVDALHHIIPLPAGLARTQYEKIGQRQIQANKLPTCLVFSNSACIYYAPDGMSHFSSEIPIPDCVSFGKLKLCVLVAHDLNYSIQERDLWIYAASHAERNGHLVLIGDLTKGGRIATSEERAALAGLQESGIPRGLTRCPICEEWSGECLDPQADQLLVRVHCRCENDNLCAQCHHLLHARKLNANYYSETGGRIWHVPAFAALNHDCSRDQQYVYYCPEISEMI